MSGRLLTVIAILAALAIYLLSASLYTVEEGHQALVVRLGAPVAVETAPGTGERTRAFLVTVGIEEKALEKIRAPENRLFVSLAGL